jgi:hypothetical protein
VRRGVVSEIRRSRVDNRPRQSDFERQARKGCVGRGGLMEGGGCGGSFSPAQRRERGMRGTVGHGAEENGVQWPAAAQERQRLAAVNSALVSIPVQTG